jgi:cell wall-associated NlpC family hydrolase
MMRVKVVKKRKIIILTIIVTQIINASCSRKLLQGLSYQNPPAEIKIEVPDIRTKVETSEIKPEEKIEESLSEKQKQQDIVRLAGQSNEFYFNDAFSEKIIETAKKYIGVPHCMGGMTDKCLDCSGFVAVVFGYHGIPLPHNSQAQSGLGTKITVVDDLRRGDIVFFSRSYKTSRRITHAGIYVGNNEFIHASSGQGVTITSLDDPFWKRRYEFGTRILNTPSQP